MPTHAAANEAIQQMYINGHFCYDYKFGIITNGLGIVRDITFYKKRFLAAHPDIIIEKTDFLDEDKLLADSKAWFPVLIDFFQKNPFIYPQNFLGDAAFDTILIYRSLFGEIGFEKVFIPLQVKLSMEENGYTFTKDGIPCFPCDLSLPMKREGSKSDLKSRLPTMKFVCPKMKWEYNPADKSKRRVCHCDNPCTVFSAEALLAGIVQLITVMVADRIHKQQCLNLKLLPFHLKNLHYRTLFLFLIKIASLFYNYLYYITQ